MFEGKGGKLNIAGETARLLRVARGEISARVYDCYLYRSHVTLWVPFLILREKRYVIRKTGIIRGCFINFHPRDKSALMLAIANETDESLRKLHPLRTTVKILLCKKNNPNIYILKNFIEKFSEKLKKTDNEKKL